MDTKRCTKCGETKPVSMFHNDRSTKTGLLARCRLCEATKKQAYIKKHKRRVAASKKKYRKNSRDTLSPEYVRVLIKAACPQLDDIPEGLMEAYRAKLKLFRAIHGRKVL